jgi:hypothetical protein
MLVAASATVVLTPVVASAKDRRPIIVRKDSNVRDQQANRGIEERYTEPCKEEASIVTTLLDLVRKPLRSRNSRRPS